MQSKLAFALTVTCLVLSIQPKFSTAENVTIPHAPRAFEFDLASGLSVLGKIKTLSNVFNRFKELRAGFHQIIFEQLKLDPNSTLADGFFPAAKRILNATKHRIVECYDSTVGEHKVDIFHESLLTIVVKWFEKNLNFLDTSDLVHRIRSLLHNVRLIAQNIISCAIDRPHNSTEPVHKLGLTGMSALTQNEFMSLFNKTRPDHVRVRRRAPWWNPAKVCRRFVRTNYTEFDWRTRGVVNPEVKQQGQCGSCWIFSSLAIIESATALQARRANPNGQIQVESLSEQAIVDCQNGCKGGWAEEALHYTVRHGVVKQRDYPYKGRGQQCSKHPTHQGPKDFCFHKNTRDDEELKSAIVGYGPVGVSISATPQMQHLKGEWNADCPRGSKSNHAITAVGWTKTHWIIRNSWGTHWGLKGYLHLRRGGNRCCILTDYAAAIM